MALIRSLIFHLIMTNNFTAFPGVFFMFVVLQLCLLDRKMRNWYNLRVYYVRVCIPVFISWWKFILKFSHLPTSPEFSAQTGSFMWSNLSFVLYDAFSAFYFYISCCKLLYDLPCRNVEKRPQKKMIRWLAISMVGKLDYIYMWFHWI